MWLSSKIYCIDGRDNGEDNGGGSKIMKRDFRYIEEYKMLLKIELKKLLEYWDYGIIVERDEYINYRI